jgi:hypothetical protein
VDRHSFDLLSAVLGILGVAAGLLVALGAGDELGTSGPWWFAAAIGVVGLLIIPWRRRSSDVQGADSPAPGDA